MGVEDGLSQNMVYSIIQDKTGFMWLGTQDGLNRYNGIEFKIFKKDGKNPDSIGSNAIFSLLEDDNGIIWVGTANGVYMYSTVDESFSHLKIAGYNKRNITGIVRDIKKDKQGNIWMAIQNEGLFCYTKDAKIKM
jgi:ligand-binding sensor domain-containing protein